jgi:chemotaxis protein MotB
MAKKKKNRGEEYDNLDRWLVSYADFITLMFAFFVTMYAISRVDERKLGSVVESLQRALGSTILWHESHKQDPGVFQNSDKPIDVAILPLPVNKGEGTEDFEALAAEIKKNMEQMVNNNGAPAGIDLSQLKFLLDKRGLILRFSERFFFDSGDASIRPDVAPMLHIIAESLEKIPNHIRIEGHTDSVPIHTARFPSNWELSTARATSIVHYLLTHQQFEPTRLSAAGYGEFRPIAPNTSPEGRSQNRRVDIVILSGRERQSEPGEEGKANQIFPTGPPPSGKLTSKRVSPSRDET